MFRARGISRSHVVVLLACCYLVTGDFVPNSIHLALTGDPSQMVVSWFTFDPSPSTAVQFGSQSGVLNSLANGTQNTFNPSTGYTHDVVLTGLTPSTRYFYRCGMDGVWSAEYSFQAAPADGTTTMRLAVFGDMGSTHSEPVVAMMTGMVKNGSIDSIVHTGDISYADDGADSNFDSTWASFFKMWQPDVMPNIPYMAAPGNHDEAAQNSADLPYAKNWTVFKNRFRMPGQESGSNTNMFFSYNHGPYHFIMLSSETNFPNSPRGGDPEIQLRWIENDLKIANLPQNRAAHPWIIVVAHRPMYTSIVISNALDKPIGSCHDLQVAFEGLFKKYNVDVFFNGHIHGYERMWPVYDSVVKQKSYSQPTDTVHLMVGAGGNVEGQDPAIAYSAVPPSWLAFRWVNREIVDPFNWERIGFGILTNVNTTTLHWQFYGAVKQELVDEIYITKGSTVVV
eukprot:TRINITY_DN11769_c0_g1_i1.p1 TRINITY_DN11769_c0_g1~~TRINITY_DN11769_c0_g1_i1.p1  ORF type:complete len:453 (+),score=24.28 TRINITY_DN11769_c0_g1_i1:95-1453(+)